MFKIKEIDSRNAPNPEPWFNSYSERLTCLKNYISKEIAVTVLISKDDFGKDSNSNTTRFRCHNIAQSAAKGKGMQFVYFFENEIVALEKYWANVACVTFCRNKWSISLANLVKKLKVLGIPLLYDLDDLVFDIKCVPEILFRNAASDTDEQNDKHFSRVARHSLMASLVDGFTVTNALLGNKLQEFYHKPYAVIPNFFNDEQFLVSKYYLDQKNNLSTQTPFLIGYFSGSRSHRKDFIVACDEILSVLKEHIDTRLIVAGYMDFPDQCQPFFKTKQIVTCNTMDICKLQHLISTVDVNIAPLVDCSFSDCKSDIKYFEAAAVGTPTIASPALAFTNAIINGHNGYLAREGEWKSNILSLYNNRRTATAMASKASEHMYQDYYGETVRVSIENAYNHLLLVK